MISTGLKIQKIENLILTKDQNESIDFTDNDIVRACWLVVEGDLLNTHKVTNQFQFICV